MIPRQTAIIAALKEWLVAPPEPFSAPLLYAERAPSEEGITGYPAVLIHTLDAETDYSGVKKKMRVALRLYVQETDRLLLHEETERLELDIVRGIRAYSRSFGASDFIYESTRYQDGVISSGGFEASVRLAEIRYTILFNEARK